MGYTYIMDTTSPSQFACGIKTYNAAQFRWNGKIGTADASDLRAEGELLYSQLYTTGAAKGFWCISPTTGKTLLFRLDDVDRSDEGDITVWSFHCDGIFINIIND